MTDTNVEENTTRATARLPGLEIDMDHHQPPSGEFEQISINLRAIPSFDEFGQFLGPPLAEVLIGIIGEEATFRSLAAQAVSPIPADDIESWEQKLESQVATDPQVPETDRLAIIRARRGQGLFRERVSQLETRCRVTGVENPVYLVSSHCKPWRDSNNEERLDGENGLLLTPSIDHLFDRGFISFENDGRLLVSPVAHVPSLQKMGIEPSGSLNVGGFTSGQRTFLEFHRSGVFLEAVRR
ncbi:MAG: HNH endonuclease signature motif containing protein [Xanthobacteraceae bacterium]